MEPSTGLAAASASTPNEDDEIVRELDVYVCDRTQLMPGFELCLLAYPLRPPWRDYDYSVPGTAVRYKQNATRMEMEVPLDTKSPCYLALSNTASDGSVLANPPAKLEKVTLRSAQVDTRTSLAVGAVVDGKLLLAPVSTMLQLRPVLTHLPVGKKGGDAGKGDDDDDGDEDEEQKQPVLRAVEVQVQKRETERQQQARLNSYAYISQKEDEEPWKALHVHTATSRKASDVYDRLMTAPMQRPEHSHLERGAYLTSFLPPSSSSMAARGRPVREGTAMQPIPVITVQQLSAELREAVNTSLKALFVKHSVCSMANVRTWLLSSGIARDGATLPDKTLDELVVACGLPVVRVRRMYVLRQTGRVDTDPLRAIVVDLLREKESFKRSEATEIANSQSQPVTDTLYAKVVKELCVSRGQHWSLKNGADM